MERYLKQTYYRLVLPAAAGFILLGAMKASGLLHFQTSDSMEGLARVLFFLSAVCAVALPLAVRTGFISRVRSHKRVSESELLAFEKWFLYSAMPAPYLALAVHILDMPGFYVNGTFLMALYAVYYYYPSRRRIDHEKRIFRI